MSGTRGLLRLSALAVAGVMVLGAAACTDNRPDAGGRDTHPVVKKRSVGPGKSVTDKQIPQLKVGVIGKVPTLDPKSNIGSGLYTNTLGLESLLRIGSNGRLEPWLATGYEQKSDKVYEYRLRKGVKFWDGSELTSDDVKYSWDHYRFDGSTRSRYFRNVADISTPDTYTVRVELKTPDGSWKYTPAMFWSVIFQKKFAQEHKKSHGKPGTLLVATGPWKFDSLNPTSGMELSANPYYWGGKPPIGRISVKSYADDNSMALALRAGEIDLSPSIGSPKGFNATAGKNSVTTVAICATTLLSMPTKNAPWDDVHVRRAVAYGLDRKNIIASTQGRAGAPLQMLISPILMRPLGSKEEVDSALATIPVHDHDLGKAKAELAKSKVPNGFSGTFVTPQSMAPTSEVIVDQLKKVGINLKLKSMTDTTWAALITGPADKRPMTIAETGACSPDPSWDDIFLGKANTAVGGLNLANYTPPEVDKLLASGLTTNEPKKRLQIYTDLLRRLGKDLPYVPLYAEGNHYASMKYDIVGYDSFWMNMPWALNVVAK
ncbi:ABC transporter substrate-binding protein [Streptomyces malaysiensis]|uniref:ABC transporter substrate-binding protein n=1 Tax=Streptomyces malaysiensis subsp. samsunensis TaxID=459658 RepID=A0A9X2M369_STRMQ|nr:ABC transporter substrate-binding protein [Streptomyces samsunensis]MCQ8835595.1 ABC transporter substrate-binding protein [Streptomyces samsunensis]